MENENCGEGLYIQKSLVSNTLWNTAGIIIYNACQWLITIIVVWLYDDFTNAGLLGLAMSVTNVFSCIATYNLRAYQVSDIHDENSDSVYIATRIITVLGAVMLCAVFLLFSGRPAQQVLIIMCYMGFRSVESLIDVLHGIVHKHRRLDIAGISMIARGVLMLAAFTVLGSLFDLLPAIIGMTAVTALFGVVFDVPKSRKLAVFTDNLKQEFKSIMKSVWGILKSCFPLMLAFLIITFFASYTRYSLERIEGTDALGAFTSATTPAVALQLIASFMLAPQMNLFSDSLKEANRAKFFKVFFISLALISGITLAAVLTAYLLGSWALELVLGPVISPYTYLLPWAMVATGMTSLLWFMNVVFTTLRDIKVLFFACLAGVITCVTAADYFIGRFGLNGANYAMIISQGVVFVILCVRLLMKGQEKETG